MRSPPQKRIAFSGNPGNEERVKSTVCSSQNLKGAGHLDAEEVFYERAVDYYSSRSRKTFSTAFYLRSRSIIEQTERIKNHCYGFLLRKKLPKFFVSRLSFLVKKSVGSFPRILNYCFASFLRYNPKSIDVTKCKTTLPP